MTEPRRDVFSLTDAVQLRFKVDSVPRLQLENRSGSTISNFISFCARKLNASTQAQQSPTNPPLTLKFVDKLTNECIIVGNERRLDVILITFIDEGIVDSRPIGRITVNFDICHVRVERKKCNVAVTGDRTIQIYTVDLKKESIYQESVYQTEEPIIDIVTFSESTLLVFNHKEVLVLSTQNGRILFKEKLQYQKPRANLTLKLLSVPRMVDKFVNVFFYDPGQINEEGQLFSLFKCQITQEGQEFRMSPILDVYKINVDYLKVMQLHNYDRETFLINLMTQVLVIKRHYPIDAGELKYRHDNSRLVYLENRNLLHICDTRVEAHTLEVMTNSIQIKSFDCINLTKPKNAKLLTAINLNDDRFAIFYVPTNNHNIDQTKYWVMGTIKSNIKSKLKDLIKRTNDLQEIQDVAEKMGLTKKQIFLELWMQSSKNKKEDFDILLETEDYKTIISQLKSSLRKECISFKQIERIEKACLKMLERQMAVTPTESLIRNYIKCHFLLRKYEVELSIKSREMRASQLGGEEDKKLSLSIQQFQDMRKRHIIKYLVELMKSLHEDPNRDKHIDGTANSRPNVFKNLVAMRYYIDGFKMVLRAIYRDFLREIITELTSDDLLSLLKVYSQLLPKKDEAKQEYTQKSGVWANITSLDWSKTIEFEKIQTIDNVHILNGMMTKDWFRWDWLIKHDIMKLKRQEFEKKFLQDREEKIYYVFFDLLFNILKKDDKNLEAIVTKVEETYNIPQHLVGKIFLYWELHQFFSRPGVLPGYELCFEQFLPLKQDEIYQLVFSNEKNCKRLILTDIKGIYNSITRCEMYDDSILTYFKAPYSTVADLKYLLNRINNQKMEFHESNQNLYKVLVEAVYYKLRWQNNQSVPIRDVLVYFESIPLYDDELAKLQQIEKIERHADLLSKLQLDMNLKEFFSNGTEVLRKLAKYYIEGVVPTGTPLRLKWKDQQDGISFMDIMNELLRIRDDLFKDNISNHTVLEVVVSFAMDYDELVPDVERMINEDGLLKQFDIVDPEGFMERIVHEKVMRAYQVKPVFENHRPFIASLLRLLPNESLKKKELQAHLDLGLLLSVLDNPPNAPLIISSRFIQKILVKQKVTVVNGLDIDRIYELMCAMGCTQGISSLHEVLILKYLEEGEWEQAIKYIGLWNRENNNKSIVFSALLINKIGEELSKELKNNLVEIVIIKYHRPDELLHIARQIIECQEIKKRKSLITNIVLENEAPMDEFFEANELISEQLKLTGGELAKQRLNEFFDNIRKGDIELQKKEIYYLYYRLLLCEPIRAHELHSKYFEELDITRIEAIFLEMHRNTNNLFNPLETILFFYKSLIVLFTSNYLGMEFKKLDVFFRLPYEDIEHKYRNILDELPKEMARINEKEKYMILKSFKRWYNRKRDIGANEEDYSMEAQEEDDDEVDCMSDIKRMAGKSKPYNKIQTKKTINPVRVIQPATPLAAEEEHDQFDGASQQWKQNLQEEFGRSSPIVSHKRGHGVTNSVRYNPKVRDLNSEKDNIHGLSRNSLDLKHADSIEANNEDSPSKLRKKLELEEPKSMKSAHYPGQATSSEISSINSHPIKNQGQQQPQKEKKQLSRTFNQTSSRLKTRKLQNRQELESPNKDVPVANQYIQPTIYFDRGEESQRQLKQEQPEETQQSQQVEQSEVNPQPSQRNPDVSENLVEESSASVKPHKTASELETNNIRAEQSTVQPQVKAEDPQNRVNILPETRYSRKQKASPVRTEVILKQEGLKGASEKEQQSPEKLSDDAKPIEATSMSRSQIRKYMEEVTQPEQTGLQTSTTTPLQGGEVQLEQPQQEEITDERTREIVDAILTAKDYSKLQQEISKQQANELAFLQRIVRIIFKKATFKVFLQIVEKLKTINIKFQSAVRAQNLRVMRNAFKAELNFDLRLIFTPEVLYLSGSPTMDIESHNKLIFDSLKPRIKELVNDTNLFVISKLMSLSFNFNKSFEFRVQYYYLEGLMRNYLNTKYRNEQQAKMVLEKIDALLSRLPINVTAQRFGKMMAPLQGSDPQALAKLLNVKNQSIQIFASILDRKKDSTDGQKFQSEIASCQAELSRMIDEIVAK